jgi:hypothetical protein
MLVQFSQPVETDTIPVLPIGNINQKSKFIFSGLRQDLPSSLGPPGFLANYLNAASTLATIVSFEWGVGGVKASYRNSVSQEISITAYINSCLLNYFVLAILFISRLIKLKYVLIKLSFNTAIL